MSTQISRRTILRGLGTAMALPLLDVMAPTAALAQAGKVAPVRSAFLFVPNGMNMEFWKPAAQGVGYAMPETLAQLAPLRDSFNVLSGLTQFHAFANGDGPGDHARSAAAWLTGVQPKKTAGTDISVGVSADQLIAASRIGQATQFHSLELGCERGALAGDCDSGYSCAYSSGLSWKNATTPIAKEVSPRLVFERLFGSGDAAADRQSRAIRNKYRQSILDFVAEDAEALRGKIGVRDQRKIDEYFAAVREIEQRLVKVESENADAVLAGAKIPGPGVPIDRGDHIRLMGDMMILAFQADLTRVATFMFANEGSNRPYREINVSEGHHDISHHGGNPDKLEKKKQIDQYHVAQLAYILNKMQSIQEGSGTMLDNSLVVFGGGIGDGNRHNHDDLPILIAGKGGGKLKGGRHIVYPNRTPLNNLFISMMDFQGVRVEQLGDSNGKLQGLF